MEVIRSILKKKQFGRKNSAGPLQTPGLAIADVGT
jgi:hypothetical protein